MYLKNLQCDHTYASVLGQRQRSKDIVDTYAFFACMMHGKVRLDKPIFTIYFTLNPICWGHIFLLASNTLYLGQGRPEWGFKCSTVP